MNMIDLPYGNDVLKAEFDPSQVEVLDVDRTGGALSDAELGELLERPVASPQIEELVKDGGSVLIVVPDATRSAAAGQVLNLLVRRLISAGIAPYEIAAIFATGIHRPVTDHEKEEILTPFIAQRTKALDHSPRDLAGLVRLGETSSGIPVELNRALKEFDHVIIVGAVTYHYFAGFTGGRKLVCPGLASSRTVSETHRLAFDFERGIRAKGVGIGKLAGNPVHEAFVEAASLAPPAFAVNTIVDAEGSATDLLCGDWLASHEEACDRYRSSHSKQIIEKRELVIASCGGSPYDINLIQAHKALETASYACQEGGTILLMAECPDGLGRPDFLEWFSSGTSDGIAAALTERYQVNGQTAWSLMDKSERFDVRMISELDDAVTEAMGMRKVGIGQLGDLLRSATPAFILPRGAHVLPVLAA